MAKLVDPLAVEYGAWSGMCQRCTNPKDSNFKKYGARGIKIYARWLGKGGFTNFLADVGRRPSPEHSIDRFPDNDGNYDPGNVRWATQVEQQNNRRDNVRLTVNGETRTATEWARYLGFPREVVARRIRLGWSPERAVTVPIREWATGRPKARATRVPG